MYINKRFTRDRNGKNRSYKVHKQMEFQKKKTIIKLGGTEHARFTNAETVHNAVAFIEKYRGTGLKTDGKKTATIIELRTRRITRPAVFFFFFVIILLLLCAFVRITALTRGKQIRFRFRPYTS